MLESLLNSKMVLCYYGVSLAAWQRKGKADSPRRGLTACDTAYEHGWGCEKTENHLHSTDSERATLCYAAQPNSARSLLRTQLITSKRKRFPQELLPKRSALDHRVRTNLQSQ